MNRCPEQDAILAVFLDGCSEDASAAREHLAGCADCAAALRRARRLDAVLANHSSTAIDDATADRLLTAATPAPARQPRRIGVPLLAAACLAAACLTVGIGIGIGFRTQPAPQTIEPRTATRPDTPIAAPSEDPLTVVLPGEPGRRGLRRSLRPTATPEHILLSRGRLPWLTATGTATLLRAFVSSRWPTAQEFLAEAEALARTARRRAGLQLLASRRDADRRVLFRFLATEHDATARELIGAVREDASAIGWLVQRVQGPDAEQWLNVAGRIGTPRVDRALLRLLRRTPELTPPVVAGIVRADDRPQCVSLMLDIHSLLTHRGHDLALRLPRWFRQLPDVATTELIAAARQASRHSHRQRCLRALAWRRDPQAVPFLLGLIGDNNLETSLAAGYALSQLPGRDVAATIHDHVAASPRGYVLLAALFGMRASLARDYARRQSLTPEEIDFLRGGRFSPEQFSIAARLCRRRHLLAD